MPPGTPYNSFVLRYPIRVDNFAELPTQDTIPALHLLTHTHSDHVNGLSAQSFGYVVICSRDAKEMLLRHEVYAERELHELELRAEKNRTYSHLKVAPLVQNDGTAYYAGSRDLLVCSCYLSACGPLLTTQWTFVQKAVPLHTPIQQELSDGQFVSITLLDANHCPGAVMSVSFRSVDILRLICRHPRFLIEGSQGSVLHTGDFRAEPWFLESLHRNPFLQPYLALDDSTPHQVSRTVNPAILKTLDSIYLDTACVLSTVSVPTKVLRYLAGPSYSYLSCSRKEQQLDWLSS